MSEQGWSQKATVWEYCKLSSDRAKYEYFLSRQLVIIKLLSVMSFRGYMAPEYLYQGEISTQSDIYSLGLMIIEITILEKNYTSDRDQSARKFIENVRQCWWLIGKSLYHPLNYGVGLHNPPNYEIVYITPWTFQNRSNYPLNQFWKIIINHRKIIK